MRASVKEVLPWSWPVSLVAVCAKVRILDVQHAPIYRSRLCQPSSYQYRIFGMAYVPDTISPLLEFHQLFWADYRHRWLLLQMFGQYHQSFNGMLYSRFCSTIFPTTHDDSLDGFHASHLQLTSPTRRQHMRSRGFQMSSVSSRSQNSHRLPSIDSLPRKDGTHVMGLLWRVYGTMYRLHLALADALHLERSSLPLERLEPSRGESATTIFRDQCLTWGRFHAHLLLSTSHLRH